MRLIDKALEDVKDIEAVNGVKSITYEVDGSVLGDLEAEIIDITYEFHFNDEGNVISVGKSSVRYKKDGNL